MVLLGSSILTLSLAFALGGDLDSYAVAEEMMTVSCEEGANVRSGPGKQNAIIDCLPQGTSVSAIYEEDGWYAVEYDNISGYIRKDLLTLSPSTISMKGGEIPMEVTSRIGVNVRSGPGTDQAILGDLEQGTVIIVTDIENNWCSFDYKGETGYVYSDWLTETGKEATDLNVVDGNAKKFAEKTMVVECKMGVNIRSDASTGAAKLGTLDNGTEVQVTDEKNGWWRISHNGKIGYVYQEWLVEKE